MKEPKLSGSVKRNSKLGIASVVISIAVPALWITVIAAAMIIGTYSRTFGTSFGIGGAIFAILAPAMHFVGAIIGIAGFFSKETKNFYPAVGTVLNLLLGISGVLLITLIASNLKFGLH
ncbi:MAG: hypothetical protein R2681_12190 [Pyrinomonadaceae bacterium]